MTQEELKAIEARANAATPGPWKLNNDGVDGRIGVPGREALCEVYDGSASDAAFIAYARVDVTRLLAEVRRLEFDLEEASAFAMGNVHAVNALHEQIKELKAELTIARASREPKP